MAKQEPKAPRDSAPTRADMLTRKMGRFTLTMAVAKRAAILIDRYGPSRDGVGTVERALADVASGRVKIVKERIAAEPSAGPKGSAKKRKRAKRAA